MDVSEVNPLQSQFSFEHPLDPLHQGFNPKAETALWKPFAALNGDSDAGPVPVTGETSLFTTARYHDTPSLQSRDSVDLIGTPFPLAIASDDALLTGGADPHTPNEIVFVDQGVDDYESLISGVSARTEVVVLDAQRDGITQISEVLEQRDNISAIHLVSHGQSGYLQLGSAHLSAETLSTYASTIQTWAGALTADADILVYGCDVATDQDGVAFIQQLQSLTGADIAASSDRTGSQAQGGDWDLEVAAGIIETDLAFNASVTAAYDAVLARIFSRQSDAIIDGLDGLASWASTFEQFGSFAEPLPLVGESIGEALELSQFIREDILQTVQDYFTNPDDPTTPGVETQPATEALVNALQDAFPSWTVSDGSNNNQLAIAIQINENVRQLEDLPIDFGTAGDSFGLKFDGTVDANARLQFDFTFGFDLTDGLSSSEAFFVDIDQLRAFVRTPNSQLNFDANVGFLEVAVQDGRINLDTGLSVDFNDPSGNNKLTLDELLSTPISGLVDINLAGSNTFSANLPVEATLGTSATTVDGVVSIDETDFDFTGLPDFNVEVSGLADRFTKLTPGDAVGALIDLGNQIENITAALNLKGGIPFVSDAIGELVGFAEAFTDLTNDLFDPSIIGTRNAPTRINQEARFSIILDGAAPVEVVVPAGSGTNNDNFQPLVNAIQAALDAAGLDIQAGLEGEQITLTATDPDVQEFRLAIANSNNNAAVTALGFQDEQVSAPQFKFDTIQELMALLDANDLLGPLNLDYQPGPNLITFDLDFAKIFSKTIALNFREALDLDGVGELSLSGGAAGTIDARGILQFGAGFDLLTLRPNVSLSRLNGGIGMRTKAGVDDLNIQLHNGDDFSIDLDGVTTVAELIERIETRTNNRVKVTINDFGDGFVLEDTTTGTNSFTVAIANDSAAGFDLGFGIAARDQDTDGDDVGDSGIIRGSSVIQRFFIDPTNSKVSARVELDSDDITLAAALGFLELEVDGDIINPFVIKAETGLQDIITDGRLYLNELTQREQVNGKSQFKAVTTPTFDIEGGSLALQLNLLDAATYGIDIDPPSLSVEFLTSGSGFNTTLDPKVDLDPGAFRQLVRSFQNLSLGDVLRLVVDISQSLAEDFDLLNQNLPLIDQSINDVLSFVTESIDSVTAPLQSLRSDLETQITALKDSINNGNALAALNALAPTVTNELGLKDQLFVAIATLEGATKGLSGEFNVLLDQSPTQLISAFRTFNEVVTAIRDLDSSVLPNAQQTALNTLKSELGTILGDVRDLVPSSDTLIKLVFDALGFDVPALTGGILTRVQNAKTALDDFINNLGSTTDETGEALLNQASAALEDAIAEASAIALVRAFGLLSQGIDALEDAAVDVQELQDNVLNEVLAIFPDGLFTFKFADESLLLNLHFDKSISQPFDELGFDFSLDSVTDGIIPLSFDTNIDGSLNIGGRLDLSFGVDMSNATSPQFFLLDNSEFALEALLNLEGELTAALGGVSAAFGGPGSPGTIRLFSILDPGEDGTPGTDDDVIRPASLGITLDDPSAGDGGKIFLNELASAINPNLTAQVALDLPIFINGEVLKDSADNPISLTAAIALNGFDDFEVVIPDIPPELIDAIKESITKLDLKNILTGMDTFFQLLETGLQSDLLAQLPIIGSELDIAGSSIGQFREKFFLPFKEKLETLTTEVPNEIIAAIQKMIFDTLGPGLANDSDPFNILDGAGLNILNSDIETFSDVDVQFTGDDLADPDAGLLVNLGLGSNEIFAAPFDLGLDGLGFEFETNGAVEVGLGYAINIGFGLNRTQGFFMTLDEDAPEIEFTVDASLAPGTELEAKLFFLNLIARENTAGEGVGFNLSTGLELKEGSDRLTLRDLSRLEPNFDFTTDVNIDILLEANLAKNSNLPSISTGLDIDWLFSLGNSVERPEVIFKDLSLNLGDFLTNMVKPVVEQLEPFIRPIQPVLQILDTEIPVISDLAQLLGQDAIKFRDAIRLFGSGTETIDLFFETLSRISQAIDIIDGFADTGNINFGDLDFTKNSGIDLTNSTTQGSLKSGLDLSTLTSQTGPIDFASRLNNENQRTLLTKNASEGGLGLSFPIFQDPGQIFGLLFGQTADLVKWDVPRLDADFTFKQKFGPIIPPVPLFASIGGSLGLFADFALGLDTRGLQTGDFFNGFFFDDLEDGVDVPELGLTAKFGAGAELSVLVASAGVEGGIEAGIFANWNDPDSNGKVYLDELAANLSRGLKCIFDFEGALNAFFDAFVKLGFDTPFGFVTLFEKTLELVNVTLLDFNASCPPLPDPIIAEQEGDNVVYLNIGDRASRRQPGAEDGDETISVIGEGLVLDDDGNPVGLEDINEDGKIDEAELRAAGDFNGNGVIDDNVIGVIGFGQTKVFENVAGISGNGGLGKDTITIDASVKVNATLTGGDGDDKLHGGSGNDAIKGNAGNDTITGGSGADELFGDTNQTGAGGNDKITGGAGTDSIFGGGGDDIIIGDTGADQVDDARDIIFGDAGNDNIRADGGNDEVHGGTGSDQIQGGKGEDELHGGSETDLIEGGADSDRIFGDDGDDLLFGEADGISTDADGDDEIYGGAGNDTIRDDVGNDTIFGDGDDDFVSAGVGNDTVYGGLGNDELYGDRDIAIGGDRGNGTDYIEGGAGDDTLHGGAGSDRLIGGASDLSTLAGQLDGDDTLFGDEDEDAILGDNGTITTDSEGNVTEVTTNAAGGAGNDIIFGGSESDIILGGGQNDTIFSDPFGGSGQDIVIGDQGRVTPTQIETTPSAIAGSSGDDIISGFGGNDILLGGAGNDQVAGNEGQDIVLGDDAVILLDSAGNVLRVETRNPNQGGNDTLTGNSEADIILGGSGSDTISGGGIDDDADIILGDNGVVVRNDGSPEANDIFSTDAEFGDRDIITSGAGDDIVLGGAGNDTVTGFTGQDVIFGDHGYVRRDATDTVLRLTSLFTSQGGNDSLDGENDADIVLGGVGDDLINGGDDDADDILLGDNGEVVRNDGSPEANDIFSTDPDDGGEDVITAGAGNDIVIGGSGNSDQTGIGGDRLAGEAGDDVLLGDNGHVFRDANDEVERVITTFTSQGGDDTIEGNAGNDIALGGLGDDDLAGNEDDDILLGDNGVVVRNDGSAEANDIFSTDPDNGGEDVITAGAGNDILIGGSGNSDQTGIGGDRLSGNDGDDIALGDNAYITRNQRDVVQRIETIFVDQGGDDTVNGDRGEDLLLGGFGEDTLNGGENNDIILGDNGLLDYTLDNRLRTLDLVTTTNPTLGGNDQITAGSGEDVAFGGTASDRLQGDEGEDILLGDHGKFEPGLPANRNFISIDIGEADGGGNDTIRGGSDDDFILGQQGDDTLFGDAGEDDMLGGHNVIGGADGDDVMNGGNDADVMLGDNGSIHRTLLNNGSWGRHPRPFNDVIRDVTRFDDVDGIGGNDTMRGGAADDIVHGQRGDDRLFGNAGDDEMYGELGSDRMSGGRDQDVMLGDVGVIVRAFERPGVPLVNQNGSWHRDVLLTAVGSITGSFDIDSTPFFNSETVPSDVMLADLVLLTGAYRPNGRPVLNANGAWDTDMQLIGLLNDGNDVLFGDAGDDAMFGQGGNDEMKGGSGNDYMEGNTGNDRMDGDDDVDVMVGDRSINIAPATTELPHVIEGLHLIESITGDADITIDVGKFGTIITSTALMTPSPADDLLPVLSMVPPVMNGIQKVLGKNVLRGEDGSELKSLITVIPDMVNHQNGLAGNDRINGGNGEDTITGDHNVSFAPLQTGLERLDKKLEGLTDQFYQVRDELDDLGLNFDHLQHEQGSATGGNTIRLGNDVIKGDRGNDTIIGDDGMLSGPFVTGLPNTPNKLNRNTFRKAAIQFHQALSDLELILNDFNFAIHNLREGVRNQLPNNFDSDAPNTLRNLVSSNDRLLGGDEEDTITGDDRLMIMPLIDEIPSESVRNFTFHELDVNKRWIQSADRALRRQDQQFAQDLNRHNRRHHDTPLDNVSYLQDYDLRTGNDVVNGGRGDDFATGDYSTVVLPLITAPVRDRDRRNLEQLLNLLVDEVQSFIRDRHIDDHDSERNNQTQLNDLIAGNDVFRGGANNDVMVGDNITINLPLMNGIPDLEIDIRSGNFDIRDEEYNLQHLLPHQHTFIRNDSNGTRLGQDRMNGQGGADILFGLNNIDRLAGNGGADFLFGGKDNDRLIGNRQDIQRSGDPNRQDERAIAPALDARLLALLDPSLAQYITDISAAKRQPNPNGEFYLSFPG